MCTKFPFVVSKTSELYCFERQKAAFPAIHENFSIFLIFRYCPIWVVQKRSSAIFALLTNI